MLKNENRTEEPKKEKKEKKKFKVLIVSGHVKNPRLAGRRNVKGAKSFSGIYEYIFNDNIVKHFKNPSFQLKGVEYKVILATQNIGLKKRVKIANRKFKPDLYIEIHHDSAPYKDLKRAKREGFRSSLWNKIEGFSFHISTENRNFQKSFLFSKILADIFLSYNLTPNHYHIDGRRSFAILDKRRGIYNRVQPYGLYILYNIKSPTILIECSTIANPFDEKFILIEDNQLIFVKAINLAIYKYMQILKKKR